MRVRLTGRRRGDEAVGVDAGTLKRLLLAEMKVHRFSNEQIAAAHLGFWRNVLGVGTRGGGLLARVGHD